MRHAAACSARGVGGPLIIHETGIERENHMTWLVQAVVATVFSMLITGIAVAQSPREQLQQLTIQLQQTPNDNALRERIIKLGAEIKPMPAVPEEARRSFMEGSTIVKLAKDVESQKLAIGSFNEALKIAPWWGNAYYNLAAVQELIGQLNDAERTLKWFLLSNPSESDAREAQDHIGALSGKRKLAAAEAGAKQEQADREMAARAQRFEGDWFRDDKNSQGKVKRTIIIIRYDAGGAWRVETCLIYPYPVGKCVRSFYERLYDIQFVGTELRFKQDAGIQFPDRLEIRATYKVRATLSADGYTLRLAYTPTALNAWQEAWWADLGRVPSPRLDEFMKQ